MNKNRFEGDPKIIIDADGWDFDYRGGQPIMDHGLENVATLSLLVKPGWVGNIFLTEEQKIGSTFRDTAEGTITITKINDIRQIAEKDLKKNKVFGDVKTTVRNPESNKIEVENLITPKGKDLQKLLFTRNGQNWINQANNPAYRRVE